MENLLPSQKLDAVLNILFDNENKINTIVTLFSIDEFLNGRISKNEILLILQKIVKDGYAVSDNFSASTVIYKITFDGMVLKETGGYHSKVINDVQNETRIIRNEILLVRGTWAAAIVGVLVLLWQVFLYFYPVHANFRYFFWE